MLGKKIVLDEASTQLLRTLKGRTGLTHQYLCRLAFGVSLAEPTSPEAGAFDEKGLEFNRYTLTGEWDQLVSSYLREWLEEHGHDESSATEWLAAHINRGLGVLARRVRTLADVAALVPAA